MSNIIEITNLDIIIPYYDFVNDIFNEIYHIEDKNTNNLENDTRPQSNSDLWIPLHFWFNKDY